MSPMQRESFRLRLLRWRQSLLQDSSETVQHLRQAGLPEPDVTDRATREADHAVELRTRDRERKLIAKIDDALRRMDYFDDDGRTTGELFEEFFPGRNDVHRLLMEPISYANGSALDDPRGIAFADIDLDGDPDFAVACKRSRNALIRNESRPAEDGLTWLKVKLVSPRGQAGAFGAKVRVHARGSGKDLGRRIENDLPRRVGGAHRSEPGAIEIRASAPCGNHRKCPRRTGRRRPARAWCHPVGNGALR